MPQGCGEEHRHRGVRAPIPGDEEGEGGKLREPVSSPVAMFLHRTNRENEIHLHCHAPIPNVGVREDGTTGTIVSWNFYDAKLALGKAFHARFVEQVTARLGIECEFDEHGLSRVKGFPRARGRGPLDADRERSRKSPRTRRRRPRRRRISRSARRRPTCRSRSSRRSAASGPRARLHAGRRTGLSRQGAACRAGRQGRTPRRPSSGPCSRRCREEFSKAKLFEQAFREGAKAGLPFAAVNEAIQETLSDEATLGSLGRVNGQEQYRKARPFEADMTPSHAKRRTRTSFANSWGGLLSHFGI